MLAYSHDGGGKSPNYRTTRPNTPVNVIIGVLIIKELFDYSDDEIVENLMLDLHLQFALHTTSFAEQPISVTVISCYKILAKPLKILKFLWGSDPSHLVSCYGVLSSVFSDKGKNKGKVIIA